MGALGHFVFILEIFVLEACGELEVGSQGIVDQLVGGALRSHDIVEFYTQFQLISRCLGGWGGGLSTIPELLLVVEGVGYLKAIFHLS